MRSAAASSPTSKRCRCVWHPTGLVTPGPHYSPVHPFFTAKAEGFVRQRSPECFGHRAGTIELWESAQSPTAAMPSLAEPCGVRLIRTNESECAPCACGITVCLAQDSLHISKASCNTNMDEVGRLRAEVCRTRIQAGVSSQTAGYTWRLCVLE